MLSLSPPPSDQTICWDAPNGKGLDHTSGFGFRVTSGGARACFLDYRNPSGRQRRITIGSPPAWTATAARDQAAELRRRIDAGSDPLAELETERTAPTIRDLAERFEKDELPKRRAKTRADYSTILRLHILPRLGKLKVAQVSHADIEKLHRQIAATAPCQANRTVAVLSRMLNLAIKWQLRQDNPAKGIERRPEERRERYLSPAELVRLAEVLALRPGRSANAVRLLLLTGARRNEVLGAEWDQFDLGAGTWTKPASTTKQARLHRVPLSAPALQLLAEMRSKSMGDPIYPTFRMNPKLEAHCSDFLRFPEVPPRFVAGYVRFDLGRVFGSSI